MEDRIKDREEREKKDLWAIEDLYTSDEDWYKELSQFRIIVEKLSSYAGHLGETPEILLEFMREDEALLIILDRLINYAHRKNDEDTRVSTYQAMNDQLTATLVETDTLLAFEIPELISIDDNKLFQYFEEVPELKQYQRYLTEIRRRKEHILSNAEERLLAAAGEMASMPDTIYSMLCDADFKFPDVVDDQGAKHPLSQGLYAVYMESPDRHLRQSAFEQLYRVFAEHKNMLAATLSAQVKQLQFYSTARRYPSALAASLDCNQVPEQVYHNLIDVVHKNLPKLHQYMDIRKRILDLDELHMYDIYAPLVSDIEVNIPFDLAKQTVREALSPLGKQYLEILDEAFANRWIDVYENPGKRSGAYSAGARVHPFVLLNYSGTVDSEFTLAHEMGHAIHSYLSNQNQRPIDSEYVIFVAEVASTCNEALLMKYLLAKELNQKQRAYLVNYFLEQFRTTLFRQTMFAEFELLLGKLNAEHESLTCERLNAEYRKLNKMYYGESMFLDDEIDLEWARIPHFYYNYYVYQYATGYASAIALSQRILTEGETAVNDYLDFLSAGCSRDPISLLKRAGVDLSTPKPIQNALDLFGELLDEMELLCSKSNDID